MRRCVKQLRPGGSATQAMALRSWRCAVDQAMRALLSWGVRCREGVLCAVEVEIVRS
ncbi:hypothetical protein Taro_000631 [Colocasia esculenta]|uniref:Uncharacterized protein n=1 Tax=Colocasia esculenta TaxID=4460 RepID=A0A843T8G5_COLES|nr:hypothetical protein [Colocasia esculenta]